MCMYLTQEEKGERYIICEVERLEDLGLTRPQMTGIRAGGVVKYRSRIDTSRYTQTERKIEYRVHRMYIYIYIYIYICIHIYISIYMYRVNRVSGDGFD